MENGIRSRLEKSPEERRNSRSVCTCTPRRGSPPSGSVIARVQTIGSQGVIDAVSGSVIYTKCRRSRGCQFAQDLGDRMRDVVRVTFSEFRRTIGENGSPGTDHGRSTAMMVISGAVRGRKVLGRLPGPDPAHLFEGRDVAVTADFRDLFAELLSRTRARPRSRRCSRATRALRGRDPVVRAIRDSGRGATAGALIRPDA